MWVLVQTQPKSTARAMRMAEPWSRVQTLEEAVLDTVGPGQGLLLAVEAVDGDHRAEDLLLRRAE